MTDQQTPVTQIEIDKHSHDDLPAALREEIEQVVRDRTDDDTIEKMDWRTTDQQWTQAVLDVYGLDYTTFTEDDKMDYAEALMHVMQDSELTYHGVNMVVSEHDPRPESVLTDRLNAE